MHRQHVTGGQEAESTLRQEEMGHGGHTATWVCAVPQRHPQAMPVHEPAQARTSTLCCSVKHAPE